jgi:hypothetical protein
MCNMAYSRFVSGMAEEATRGAVYYYYISNLNIHCLTGYYIVQKN